MLYIVTHNSVHISRMMMSRLGSCTFLMKKELFAWLRVWIDMQEYKKIYMHIMSNIIVKYVETQVLYGRREWRYIGFNYLHILK